MNMLAQTLAAVSLSDRCPTWMEYETGSPAEKRAILDRWLEISRAPLSDDWAAATGRYGRAMNAMRKLSSVEVEYRSSLEYETGSDEHGGGHTVDDQGI